MQRITILVTDDHKLLRETLSSILNSNILFRVVAECSTGEEAVEKAKLLRPNIVIMDINLSGMNGIDSTKQIRKYSPSSKILGVSFHTHPSFAQKMIKEGAMGYLTKNSSQEEVTTAILEVYAGKKYICSEVKNALAERVLMNEESTISINSLSGRELEVVREIIKGSSSKEIAAQMNICLRTVEVHRHNILKKLKLKNTASLVNYINSQSEFSDTYTNPEIRN